MTNAQLYTLLAPGILAVFGVFFGAWTTNKRLDDFRANMKDLRADMKEGFARTNLIMDAMRQDIADIKAAQRGHDVDIANLKERFRTQP